MDLRRLREETASDHEAVEALLPIMSPGLDLPQYLAYLQQMCTFVSAWEAAALEAAPAWLQPLLAARSKRDWLAQDLAWFEVSAPLPPYTATHVGPPAFPDLASLPRLLGALYVMEGSTLGGQFIARHVEQKFSLAPGRGDAYFVGYGDRTGSMWKEFCLLLAARVDESETPAAIQAAKAMFAAFGTWMQQLPSHQGDTPAGPTRSHHA